MKKLVRESLTGHVNEISQKMAARAGLNAQNKKRNANNDIDRELAKKQEEKFDDYLNPKIKKYFSTLAKKIQPDKSIKVSRNQDNSVGVSYYDTDNKNNYSVNVFSDEIQTSKRSNMQVSSVPPVILKLIQRGIKMIQKDMI